MEMHCGAWSVAYALDCVMCQPRPARFGLARGARMPRRVDLHLALCAAPQSQTLGWGGLA